MYRIKISYSDVKQMIYGLGHPGVCLACGYFDEYAGCEPDATNYECPDCGKYQLFGLEIAITMDAIDIVEDNSEEYFDML